MSFASVAGLWLGLITIPVVVLYVLKIKRHRRTVPYLKLWADLVADRQFTTLFQRLQRLLSLLLQILIALCLVFAFASLTLSDSYLEEESVVLVVDTSASMNGLEAPDGERTRIEAAIEVARGLCEGRSAEDEYAIIAAGAQPDVLQGFTRSTLRLREGLDKLAPTKASSDLAGAIELAIDLLQGKKHPRVIAIGDAAGGDVEELLTTHEVLRWHPVGESVPNVAIRRFQVRRNFALDTDYVLLAVANQSEEPAQVEIEISFEGSLKKVVPLELEPEQVHTQTLPLTLPQGGFAKAEIVHPKRDDGSAGRDGLALDDVAWAAVPAARSFRVMLVARNEAEEAPFRAAIEALGTLVDRDASIGVMAEGFAELPPEQVAAFDLVVLVNHAPETLPGTGRYLCINALPGGLPARLRGVEQNPKLRDLDAEHPINRFLEAKTIDPLEARPLDLSGGEIFMSTGGGPVGVVFRSPERRVVYLGLDLLSDLFFLRVSFPIFVRNVLAWMHEEETELVEPTYRPGEVIRPRFTIADAKVDVGWVHEWVEGDAAKGALELPVENGKFYFGETAEPGRYWVRAGIGDFRTAVNLFDAGESDLGVPDDAGESDLGVQRSGFLFGRDLWPILALVAAVLWLLEWGLYHRRLTE